MSYALRCVGLAGTLTVGIQEPPIDQYLTWYDPEADNGLGDATFSPDPEDALVLPDMRAVHDLVMSQPRNRPLRADGRPNRPLRAFHLEIVDLTSERKPHG